MKAPQLPSFFKIQKAKSFSFQPRYYNNNKERRRSFTQADSLIFEYKKRDRSEKKGRGYQIIFLIIILSLLAYKLLIS